MGVIHAAHLIQLDADQPLPTEFRLFSLGNNKTSKGTFKLDKAGMDSIMAAYKDQGVDLAIDYEHQTFAAVSNGQPAPAAGWCALESRKDGIWAVNVRWTDAAAEMLKAKEYRYFSPTFKTDKGNRITQLMPIAITNFPATKGQDALVAASQHIESVDQFTKETIPMHFETIGLKEGATEADVQARAESLVDTESRLLKLTGKDNVGDAFGELIANKDASVRLAAAESELRELHETIAASEHVKTASAISAMVDEAARTRRFGVSAEEFKKHLTEHGEAYGVEKLRSHIATYPVKVVHRQAPPPINTEAARLEAVAEYKRSHPGATAGQAMVALAAERPSLFPEYSTGGR